MMAKSKKFYETHEYKRQAKEWPEGYPEELKPVSWNFGAICGPYVQWHSKCGKETKESTLFRKKNLCNIFVGLCVPCIEAVDLIKFVCDAFVLYYVADEGFKIGLRRTEVNGKRLPVYTRQDFVNFFAGHYWTEKQGTKLIKKIIDLEIDSYNNMSLSDLF